MRRPTTASNGNPRRRGRVLTGIAGAVLAVALGAAGVLGIGSLGGSTSGHGHGVHTDIQSWS